jgi:basic membrane protein A and related proteins
MESPVRRITASILTLAAIAASSASYAADDKFKVGFVEIGTPTMGWVAANEQGEKYLREQMPSVEVKTVESIGEGPGVVPVLKSLADDGYKVIFANAYGYAAFAPKVANEYPKTIFIIQQASPPNQPNLTSYYGHMEESRYLEGVVAGRMTKSNLIGFVAAFPFSPVIAGLNAFALGAQSVNPKAVVKVAWVNSWSDAPKEKEATDALLAAGADVIASHTDSAIPLQTAADHGKWGMSSNWAWSAAAPDAFLAANVWNWGIYYTELVKSVRDGTFKPERTMGSLKNGVADVALGKNVPDDVRQSVKSAKDALVGGEKQIFAGPLSDNSGTARIPQGETLSLNDASAKMDWLVKGVEGNTK